MFSLNPHLVNTDVLKKVRGNARKMAIYSMASLRGTVYACLGVYGSKIAYSRAFQRLPKNFHRWVAGLAFGH